MSNPCPKPGKYLPLYHRFEAEQYGFTRVREKSEMVWGKEHMIGSLRRLGREWGRLRFSLTFGRVPAWLSPLEQPEGGPRPDPYQEVMQQPGERHKDSPIKMSGSLDAPVLPTRFRPIPIGDISYQSGSLPRGTCRERYVDGHSSHRCGIDVDIYYFAKLGHPDSKVNCIDPAPNYDVAVSELLAWLILKTGGHDITWVFIGRNRSLETWMRKWKGKLALKANMTVDEGGPGKHLHHNHFHIRLVSKDPEPC
jgi:hypothetical protein